MTTVKYEHMFLRVILSKVFGIGILPSKVERCEKEVTFMILLLDPNREEWIPYAEFFTSLGRWEESVPIEQVSTAHFSELHDVLQKAEDWCKENCHSWVTPQGKTAYNLSRSEAA